MPGCPKVCFIYIIGALVALCMLLQILLLFRGPRHSDESVMQKQAGLIKMTVASCPSSMSIIDRCACLLAQTSRICFQVGQPFSITSFTEKALSEITGHATLVEDPEAHLAINHEYPGLMALNSNYHIYVVDGFLAPDEFQTLTSHAQTFDTSLGLLQSLTGNNSDAHQLESCDSLRNLARSSNCQTMKLRNSMSGCPSKAVSSIVRSLHSKISQLLPGLTSHYRETLQLTRYLEGGYYTEHVDRRRATILMYLGGNGTEGATYFPKLNIRIRPKPGMAVIFFPDDSFGYPKAYMSHVSEQVRFGDKWVGQVWIGNSGSDFCPAL